MTDMDAIFAALAELAKQTREQAAQISELQARIASADTRLNAQFSLIEQMRRPANVPSVHPVWRAEAA